jgi:hypothetical protein
VTSTIKQAVQVTNGHYDDAAVDEDDYVEGEVEDPENFESY